MATSRKEPHQPNASRTNRGVRNMSPVLKPRGEPDAQGILRRARSVPSSPDRRSSASAAASSSSSSFNACRPSSSFNTRSTASSRSSSASGSSASSSSSASTHGKAPLLHSVSSMVGAKQAAGVMRRRADKSTAGATSVRPHTSPDKDAASKPAKSPSSNAQKSKLIPTRPGAEKTASAAAAPSPKPRSQKATGTGAAGKTPASASSSSARNIPGTTAKRRPAGTTETSAVPSIRRTTSVPVPAAPKATHQDQPDVDDQLLMEEFDETESISTPSIEEHLQQRLPDPVDVVTAFTATTSEPHVDAPTPSEEPSPSSREEEHENDQEAVITEHMTVVAEEKHEHLNGGDDADVAKEAAAEIVDDVELLKKEAAESNEAAIEEPVGKIELKGDVDDEPTKSNEADGEETELQQAVDGEVELKDPELLAVKKEAEEAKSNAERTVLPATKTAEQAVQRWRTNEATSEEGGSRSKASVQERRNKVMALVGRFETAMSGSGRE